jgi:hypothetical protein
MKKMMGDLSDRFVLAWEPIIGQKYSAALARCYRMMIIGFVLGTASLLLMVLSALVFRAGTAFYAILIFLGLACAVSYTAWLFPRARLGAHIAADLRADGHTVNQTSGLQSPALVQRWMASNDLTPEAMNQAATRSES